MKTHHKFFKRSFYTIPVIVLVLVQILSITNVSAEQITARSLTLIAGATDGGSMPGGVVDHNFQFTLPSSTAVGSIEFKYCTLAAGVPNPDTCVMPTGLVTTSATLVNEAGTTGFTIVNTTNGAPYLTRVSSAVTPGVVSYRLGLITNPTSVAGETFYVRISTFASIDATGDKTDTGTVAAATTRQIILSGIMPESLVFCAGATISVNVLDVPDCSTVTTGVVNFDKLFSPTNTAGATSQLAASTNAGAGYVITVNGPTLTSGSNTITEMSAQAAPVYGVSQFGMNLKANTIASTTPAIGLEVVETSNGTNYRGQAATGYDTVDQFKFTSGDTVANSFYGGPGGTDAQIFTVSYIVNVPGSQPAGTYTTTLTYICTPTY